MDTSAPEIRHIVAGLQSIAARVNLDPDADVTSEFHELLPELTDVHPVASPSSATGRLFERARWLIMLLGGIYVEIGPATTLDLDRDMADPELGNLAAVKVYWLWHLFLFDDPRLQAYRSATAEDASSLVRATSALMGQLTSAQPATEYDALLQIRESVRDAR